MPEDYPVACRENATDLQAGESALMSAADYAAHKAAKNAQWQPAPPLGQVQEAIRAEAQRRIVDLLGVEFHRPLQWLPKQINLSAKALRCVRKEAKGTATPEEIAFLDGLEVFFDKVEAIRTHSNSLESQWANGQTPDINQGWPQ